jgi:UDP-N-acetylmuramate dehydrogenase
MNIPSFISLNIPLQDKNWFKTGGNARYFAEPTTPQEFQHALNFAHKNNLDIFVLGQGANILISDDGFDGLVIRPQLKQISHAPADSSHEYLTTGAGWTMHDLIDYCLDHNLIGLEEFSGIPGTVGGSVYINLHYFEFLLEQFMVDATIINKTTGELCTVTIDWFNFGYDQSTLMDKENYLVSARFKLKKVSDIEAAYARGRRTEIIRHRAKRYPTSNTCGSFFRNFHEHEVTLTSSGKKMIFTAYYLDKIGVKGALRIGDAIVSYQHANMLVNLGNATSSDIINLARKMQQMVFEQFGIIPHAECQLVGFKEYPLLTVESLNHKNLVEKTKEVL